MYRHMSTGDEHFSSVPEVVCWIAMGPLLPPPAPTNASIQDDTNGRATSTNTRKQRVPTLDDTATQRQKERVAARSYDANGIQTKRRPDPDTCAPHTAKRLRTKAPTRVRFAMDPQPNTGIAQSQALQNRDRRLQRSASETMSTATEPLRRSPRLSAHLAAADTYQPEERSAMLQPRPQWMKDAMPGVSDEDADQTWHEANHRLYGREDQRTDGLAPSLTQPHAFSVVPTDPSCGPRKRRTAIIAGTGRLSRSTDETLRIGSA